MPPQQTANFVPPLAPSSDISLDFGNASQGMTTGQELHFNYQEIDEDRRDRVIADVLATQRALRVAGREILNAGKRLRAIKDATDHGQFQRIVAQDIGLGIDTAERMMQVATRLDNHEAIDVFTDRGQLFMLAAKSTPPAAVDRATEEAKAAKASGQTFTRDDLRTIIAEEKAKIDPPPATATRTQFESEPPPATKPIKSAEQIALESDLQRLAEARKHAEAIRRALGTTFMLNNADASAASALHNLEAVEKNIDWAISAVAGKLTKDTDE